MRRLNAAQDNNEAPYESEWSDKEDGNDTPCVVRSYFRNGNSASRHAQPIALPTALVGRAPGAAAHVASNGSSADGSSWSASGGGAEVAAAAAVAKEKYARSGDEQKASALKTQTEIWALKIKTLASLMEGMPEGSAVRSAAETKLQALLDNEPH